MKEMFLVSVHYQINSANNAKGKDTGSKMQKNGIN